jgi:hypothetical protein
MYAVVNQTLGTLELWSEYCWIWITSLFLIKKNVVRAWIQQPEASVCEFVCAYVCKK